MLTPRQIRYLIAALTFATLVKLYLALFTHGSADVDGFADHLLKIRELGVSAYHVRGPYDNPFNSPPAAIHWIQALGWLADISGLPFGFWLRLFPTLAGTVSLLIVWRLLRGRKDLFPLLIALALCPISIMVDGYHGNTDSVVIMFALLSVYLIEHRSFTWLGGIVFGLACCVKVVPLMFAPAFFFHFRDATERAKFSVAATATFVLLSLPYIVQDPIAVKNVVFGYGAIYGIWGIPQLLALFWPEHPVYAHQPFDPIGIHGVFASTLKWFTIAVICAVSSWLNRREQKPSLYVQCGIVIAILLFLAPGFGMQYLVWLVPFVVILGLRVALIYYAIAGLYLLFKYSGGVGYPSNALLLLGAVLSLGAWFTLRIVLGHYYKLVRSNSLEGPTHTCYSDKYE